MLWTNRVDEAHEMSRGLSHDVADVSKDTWYGEVLAYKRMSPYWCSELCGVADMFSRLQSASQPLAKSASSVSTNEVLSSSGRR